MNRCVYRYCDRSQENNELKMAMKELETLRELSEEMEETQAAVEKKLRSELCIHSLILSFSHSIITPLQNLSLIYSLIRFCWIEKLNKSPVHFLCWRSKTNRISQQRRTHHNSSKQNLRTRNSHSKIETSHSPTKKGDRIVKRKRRTSSTTNWKNSTKLEIDWGYETPIARSFHVIHTVRNEIHNNNTNKQSNTLNYTE
jgi:hypothetical protein